MKISLIIVLIAIISFVEGNISILHLSSNNTAYLVLHGVAKQILDEDTISSFGFKPDALKTLSHDELKNMKHGPPIALIKANDGSADEMTRVAILKSLAVMGDIVREIEHVGEYTNPSVFKFQGRSLLVTGSNNGRANTKGTRQGLLEFRWLNTSRHSFRSADKYLGIVTTEVEQLTDAVLGEDPRVVMLGHDRFQVYFVNPFVPVTRIGMMEVALNRVSHQVEVVKSFKTIIPVEQSNIRHKNWTPFLHRVNGTDEVYIVQQVNPLLVVKPTVHGDGEMYADVISMDSTANVDWPYGLIRGGTNSLLLPSRNAYLSFFHSKGLVPGGSMNTYFMGAYTFSAHAPFRLLSVSAMPIMPWRFYTGSWSPMKNARIDYCLFPTHIYLEHADIVMTAGFQDSSGYTMRIALASILDTLVPVSSP